MTAHFAFLSDFMSQTDGKFYHLSTNANLVIPIFETIFTSAPCLSQGRVGGQGETGVMWAYSGVM